VGREARQAVAVARVEPATRSGRRPVWAAAAVLVTLVGGAWWYFGRGSGSPMRIAGNQAVPAAAILSPERTAFAPSKEGPRKRVAPPMPPPVTQSEPARTTTLKLPSGGAAEARGRTFAMGAITRLSLSPDGKRVAYINGGHLWIAGIDGADPVMYDQAISTPFWSPDGRYVAASGAGRVLRRFEAGTQNTSDICVLDTNFSGAWGPDGTVLIGLQHDGIYRVPSAGGALRRVTTVDTSRGETRHIALQFLPDGRRFLYLAGSSVAGRTMLYVGSLDSAERTAIMPTPSNVQFAERSGGEGYLVYAVDSMLAATPFNWKTLKTTGAPAMLGTAVTGAAAMDAAVSMADFSVAGNMIAVHPMGPERDRITVLRNWMSGLK
jgi:hypothetical protein